jgi:hypothetical protein
MKIKIDFRKNYKLIPRIVWIFGYLLIMEGLFRTYNRYRINEFPVGIIVFIFAMVNVSALLYLMSELFIASKIVFVLLILNLIFWPISHTVSYQLVFGMFLCLSSMLILIYLKRRKNYKYGPILWKIFNNKIYMYFLWGIFILMITVGRANAPSGNPKRQVVVNVINAITSLAYKIAKYSSWRTLNSPEVAPLDLLPYLNRAFEEMKYLEEMKPLIFFTVKGFSDGIDIVFRIDISRIDLYYGDIPSLYCSQHQDQFLVLLKTMFLNSAKRNLNSSERRYLKSLDTELIPYDGESNIVYLYIWGHARPRNSNSDSRDFV